MTVQMYIKWGKNEATTVDLQANGYTVLDGYYPTTDTGSKSRISEQVDLLVRSTSPAAVDKLLQDINQIFDYVKEHYSGPDGAWIYYAPDAASTPARSRIYEGVIIFDDGLTRRRKENKARVSMAYERDPYWEEAEKQIAISNGNGISNTDGLTVFNCSDGVGASPNKQHNYISMLSNAITGDLATPVRLEMTNTYNVATDLSHIFISHNYDSNPDTLDHILEAEDSVGGTPTVAATSSGGYYNAYTWTGDTQKQIARWVLSSELLAACAGRWFKLLAKFTGEIPTGIKLQAKITFPSGVILTIVDSAAEVAITGGTYSSLGVQEIGTLQIPPWLPGESVLAPVDLTLYARKVGGGSLNIDFIQLTPLNGYRILVPQGYGVHYEEIIVDDGIYQNIYIDNWNGAAGKTGHYIGYGKQIMLQPGLAQRIYFLQRNMSAGAEPARTLSLKAFYRPRRRAL